MYTRGCGLGQTWFSHSDISPTPPRFLRGGGEKCKFDLDFRSESAGEQKKNVHHRQALSWRFRDSGVGYKSADLLSCLLKSFTFSNETTYLNSKTISLSVNDLPMSSKIWNSSANAPPRSGFRERAALKRVRKICQISNNSTSHCAIVLKFGALWDTEAGDGSDVFPVKSEMLNCPKILNGQKIANLAADCPILLKFNRPGV